MSSSLKFRPIALLVSSVYVTWVYRTFYSHYTVHIPKELIQKCHQLYDSCRSLRHNRPNVFCGFITSLLFLLAVIGHVVNGTYILLGKLKIHEMRSTRDIKEFFVFIPNTACLIAGVILTSKYEIKLIKENGKCLARRFRFLIHILLSHYPNGALCVNKKCAMRFGYVTEADD